MVQPILWSLVLKMPALGTFLRLHSPRAITLALRILDIVSVCHHNTFVCQLTISLSLRSASHCIIASFPALNPAYRPHPHHPVLAATTTTTTTTSPSKPPP